MLNKQKGNMYGFVTHTWNAIKGKCPHNCKYCYMKVFPQKELRLDHSEFNTDLGEGNFIFVGSSCDMWAWTVPDEWIEKVLEHCRKYPKNQYLFQSKNPQRFRKFYGKFPYNSIPPYNNVIFGTTLESNREYPNIYCNSPTIVERYTSIKDISFEDGGRVMVTIEPILDFDLKEFVDIISDIEPEWINIGADSKGHKMPEPNAEKINQLIEQLKNITEVRNKSNLKRLLR